MECVEELKFSVLEAYKLVPKEVGFGANCYQAAVKGTPFRSSSDLSKTMAGAARHGLGAILGVLIHNVLSKYVPWRNYRLVMRLLIPRYQSNSTASGSASPPAPPVSPNNCLSYARELGWREAAPAKHLVTSSELQKINRDLYRNAVKSITDMLTFVELIDNGPLLATVYLNQAFFHTACAYSRDMV